jgi:anti-anti-sigma regulatory factor
MPNPVEPYIRWSKVDDVAVVEVMVVELNQPAFAAEFGAELQSLLAAKASDRFLIDFKRCRYMSSTAFGALFRFIKDAGAAGVRVAVCGLAEPLKLGASLLMLDQYVPMVDDEAAGLAALAAGRPA